jgi:nucleotide-binding universal stress UspA family protein
VLDEHGRSTLAARYAIDIGRKAAGGVTVVRVVPEHASEGGLWTPLLDRVAPESHLRISKIVVRGARAVEIVRLSEACASDLIVMDVDQDDVRDHLYGTTAYVMRHAKCPVLMLPRATRRLVTHH